MSKGSILSIIAIWATISAVSFGQATIGQWKDFYESVKDDLRSDDVSVQVKAVSKFEDQDYSDAGDFLIKLIEKNRSDTAVLKKAAEVLTAFDDEGVTNDLKKKVESNPTRHPFLLSAYLARNPENGTSIAFKAMKSSRDFTAQRIAIERLSGIKPVHEKTITHLLPYLGESEYHAVRRAAANTLGKLASAEPIPELIENLKDKVIGENARDALLRLTGESHWRDQQAWKRWWESNKASYSPKNLDDDAFTELHAKLLKANSQNQVGVNFYEREITGKNILFLLDRSGSMSKASEEEGVDRIGKLKQELTTLVGSLDEEYRIGLVMFPMDTFPRRGIETVSSRFQKKALDYIDGLAARGGTPMAESAEHCYEKIVEKYNVDTIYLLSDGAPSDIEKGAMIQKMLGYVERYGVKVNCISIGRSSSMLEQIAKDSGGDYWETM
ncbi:MAG: VWA domain-containing protein [Akkermansiaceae bacterium]